MAKDSTEKLNSIVDDLLGGAMCAKGRRRMNFERVGLDELVKAAVEKYGPALLEKRVAVRVGVQGAPIRVLADPGRVTQVLNNLLTNAVKFTPEGGEISLELHASPHFPGYAALTCWNSGEEIPEQDLERIFERFEQARNPRTRTLRGTGLGLSSCRSIAEAHGGRIWAEPAQGGARFVLVLPFEPKAAALDPQPPEGDRPPRPAGGAARKVLLVESEVQTAWLLKGLLLAHGYQVTVATSAEDAVRLARRHHPEVVALEVQPPGRGDGLAVAEILRHDPDTREAALLALSAADDRLRALRSGASAFLQKPLPADKLLATLDALVHGRGRKQRGRVLVVDDDAKIAAICSEVLANIGFEVAAAATLEEARQ